MQHAKETSSEYCKDQKEAGPETYYPKDKKLKTTKQNHFLAASSRKELEVTIILFLYNNSSCDKLNMQM